MFSLILSDHRLPSSGSRPRCLRLAPLALAVLGLASARPAAAQNVFLGSDTTINNTVTAEDIFVGYANASDFDKQVNGTSPTVRLVSGASIVDLRSLNASVVNIGDGASAVDVTAANSSTVNVSGGSLTAAVAHDNGTVNISGGTVNTASGYDSGTVNVTGGGVNTNLSAFQGSIVNLRGGTIVGGATASGGTLNVSGGAVGGNCFLNSSGTMTVTGGAIVGVFGASGTGTAAVSGGSFGRNQGVNFFDNTTGGFTFLGTGLSAALVGADANFGGTDYLLTGLLSNGQSVTGDVVNVSSTARMFTLAPEPSQNAALGLGVLGLAGLALRARRREAADA